MSNLGHLTKGLQMRIFSRQKKSDSIPQGWYKPISEPDRELDLIDDRVLFMARCIRVMKARGADFSSDSYAVLIKDYSRCAKANWALTPAQRVTAIVLLKYKAPETSLFEVLTEAARS